jgi:DNA-binding NtrC family response regulator
MPRSEAGGALEVAIVSGDADTRGELEAYLREAGVTPWATGAIQDCVALAPPGTVAFVLFPDGFGTESVVSTVEALTKRRPRVLPVLVTAHARELEALQLGDKVLIVARPVWGWAILDAVRAHLDRMQSGGGRTGRLA